MEIVYNNFATNANKKITTNYNLAKYLCQINEQYADSIFSPNITVINGLMQYIYQLVNYDLSGKDIIKKMNYGDQYIIVDSSLKDFLLYNTNWRKTDYIKKLIDKIRSIGIHEKDFINQIYKDIIQIEDNRVILEAKYFLKSSQAQKQYINISEAFNGSYSTYMNIINNIELGIDLSNNLYLLDLLVRISYTLKVKKNTEFKINSLTKSKDINITKIKQLVANSLDELKSLGLEFEYEYIKKTNCFIINSPIVDINSNDKRSWIKGFFKKTFNKVKKQIAYKFWREFENKSSLFISFLRDQQSGSITPISFSSSP